MRLDQSSRAHSRRRILLRSRALRKSSVGDYKRGIKNPGLASAHASEGLGSYRWLTKWTRDETFWRDVATRVIGGSIVALLIFAVGVLSGLIVQPVGKPLLSVIIGGFSVAVIGFFISEWRLHLRLRKSRFFPLANAIRALFWILLAGSFALYSMTQAIASVNAESLRQERVIYEQEIERQCSLGYFLRDDDGNFLCPRDQSRNTQQPGS